jgi:hypothetical protein
VVGVRVTSSILRVREADRSGTVEPRSVLSVTSAERGHARAAAARPLLGRRWNPVPTGPRPAPEPFTALDLRMFEPFADGMRRCLPSAPPVRSGVARPDTADREQPLGEHRLAVEGRAPDHGTADDGLLAEFARDQPGPHGGHLAQGGGQRGFEQVEVLTDAAAQDDRLGVEERGDAGDRHRQLAGLRRDRLEGLRHAAAREGEHAFGGEPSRKARRLRVPDHRVGGDDLLEHAAPAAARASDFEYLREVARTGVHLAFDTIGKENWDFFVEPPPASPPDGETSTLGYHQSDVTRARRLAALVAEGSSTRSCWHRTSPAPKSG